MPGTDASYAMLPATRAVGTDVAYGTPLPGTDVAYATTMLLCKSRYLSAYAMPSTKLTYGNTSPAPNLEAVLSGPGAYLFKGIGQYHLCDVRQYHSL
eukprot:1424209-Rhodomonas_salina.1